MLGGGPKRQREEDKGERGTLALVSGRSSREIVRRGKVGEGMLVGYGYNRIIRDRLQGGGGAGEIVLIFVVDGSHARA
jgi:hypothetical protein